MSARKSPLKDRPLRNPGQSIDEEITRIRDKADEYAMMAIFMAVLAGMEWYRWWTQAPPYPVLYSIIAGLVVSWCGYRIFKLLVLIQTVIARRCASDGSATTPEATFQWVDNRGRPKA